MKSPITIPIRILIYFPSQKKSNRKYCKAWIYQDPKIRKEEEERKLKTIDCKKFEDVGINRGKTGRNRKKIKRNGKLRDMVQKCVA